MKYNKKNGQSPFSSMVGVAGFDRGFHPLPPRLPNSRLRIVSCSKVHRTFSLTATPKGFKSATSKTKKTDKVRFHPWSGWQDLNPRPTGPKPVALPNCATPRKCHIMWFKKFGEPTGIRTPDTRLRRPLLYPAEL